MAGFGPKANAFVSQPEPRTIGSFARGRQLCAGNFLFAGYLVEAPEAAIWDLPMPDHAFETEVHGFVWLDDLAAVADLNARHRAQLWTHEWVKRFGRGAGPGWVADLTGRRLVRWINHALFLLNGQDRETSAAFFKSMSRLEIRRARPAPVRGIVRSRPCRTGASGDGAASVPGLQSA